MYPRMAMNLSVGAGHAREIKRRVDLKIWPFPVGAGHAREIKRRVYLKI